MNNFFPLDSQELRSHAEMLASSHRHLAQEETQNFAEAHRLVPSGFQGAAADAAVHSLMRMIFELVAPRKDLERLTTILHQAARLQEQLEQAYYRVLAIADLLTETSPLVSSILHFLKTSGCLLDLATSQAIATPSINTKASHALPQDWEESAADYLTFSHQRLYDSASPAIQQLVDHHGLTLLELSPVGFVAATASPTHIAQATNFVTFVPGVNALDTNNWPEHIQRAQAMGESAKGVGIAWVGYDAPASLPEGINPGPARAAGVSLSAFQQRLEHYFPAAHKTVVGHSYGSVVAGNAALNGLYADDLIFLGSPGVGADNVSQLHLYGDNPRVHALTVPGDPISFTTGTRMGIHGVDPSSPGFGAQVWGAPEFGSHSWYFDDPTKGVHHILRNHAH